MKKSFVKTRIIGIDYGLVRIGLAVSDELKMIASPLQTIRAKRQLKETVKMLLEHLRSHNLENGYRIEKIVVGLPLMMNGQMGVQADEVVRFVELIKEGLKEESLIFGGGGVDCGGVWSGDVENGGGCCGNGNKKGFADKEMLSIPIVMWDERLTSVQAERAMKECGMSRKKRSKCVDGIAAVIILQSYLDQCSEE